MPTLESINELLNAASQNLEQAASDIRGLPLDPVKVHIHEIAQALTSIFEIQLHIYALCPDLKPTETPIPDPDLTEEQKSLVSNLSQQDLAAIDNLLLSTARPTWKKVAFIVGTTMTNLPSRVTGIPDVFYSQRIRSLVENGYLESQGDLSYMRFSEIRLPHNKEPNGT